MKAWSWWFSEPPTPDVVSQGSLTLMSDAFRSHFLCKFFSCNHHLSNLSITKKSVIATDQQVIRSLCIVPVGGELSSCGCSPLLPPSLVLCVPAHTPASCGIERSLGAEGCLFPTNELSHTCSSLSGWVCVRVIGCHRERVHVSAYTVRLCVSGRLLVQVCVCLDGQR